MFKNNLLFLLPLIVCLFACASKQPTPEKTALVKVDTPNVEKPQMTGNDRDEHNCIPSAGYQWSEVKKECIRLFEKGIRLEPKAENLNKTVSAFAVFKSDADQAQVEIFIPNEKKSILLTQDKKSSTGLWKNDVYQLLQLKGMYLLEDAKGTVLYQGAAK
ncbi:MAG: hypothetical protein RIS64_1768 [Bacteroidota bacterium]|jgi:hypothetical protein